jgi:hypothetical protein
MKKIVFLCNWGESPLELLDRYSRQTPNEFGIWKNLQGVANIGDADYYIVLEGYSGELPLDNTIYVKREPKFIRDFHAPYKNIIDWSETNCGITWWINKTYDELKSMPYPKKTKKISCVVSSKHEHRETYVKSLFTHNSPIDLYGKGHDRSYYGDHYKGALDYDGKCKLAGLIDYEYSIVLENSQQKNYFTEKLADAFLSWSKPLYWGCPNLSKLFPTDSFTAIELGTQNPATLIAETVSKPINIEALNVARNLILDRFNIWEIIYRKINGDNHAVLQPI